MRDQQAELVQNLGAREAELERAQTRQRELTLRVRELEGQLALAQAEASDLRAAPRREVVRIGPTQPSEPEESRGSDEPNPTSADDEEFYGIEEGEADGPRPVLRIYGNADAETSGGAAEFRGELPPLALPTRPPHVPETLPVTQQVPSIAHMARVAPAVSSATLTSGRGTDGDPVVNRYRRALALVRDRQFREALPALESFAADHPSHGYTDNAVYWQAEVLYVLRDYPRALSRFESLLRRYPRTNKAPDALLKMALCHQRMGNSDRARALFDRVQREYPNTIAAQMASREGAS